jgi:hypothetical protein
MSEPDVGVGENTNTHSGQITFSAKIPLQIAEENTLNF